MLEVISLGLLLLSVYRGVFKFDSVSYGVYYFPFVSLLIYVYAFQSGALSYLLSNKLFVYLGKISYATFMIHVPLILYICVIFGFPYTEDNAIRNFLYLFVYLVVLCFSDVIYRYYEVPIGKYLMDRINIL